MTLRLPVLRVMIAIGAAIGATLVVTPRAAAQGAPTVRRINPPALSTPTGYTHVVEASGGRTLYISGQVALDSTGALVGASDFRAQTTQAMENLRRALAAGGATFADVVKINWYVTDATQVGVVREVRARYISADRLPASTFVAVRALARPEWLIEIEAIAVTK